MTLHHAKEVIEQALARWVTQPGLARSAPSRVIVPEGEITRNSERAALSKGLQLRVFDSEPGALSWLLADKPM